MIYTISPTITLAYDTIIFPLCVHKKRWSDDMSDLLYLHPAQSTTTRYIHVCVIHIQSIRLRGMSVLTGMSSSFDVNRYMRWTRSSSFSSSFDRHVPDPTQKNHLLSDDLVPYILLFLDVRVTTDNDRSNCLELVAIADHTLTFSQYEVYGAILLKQ